MTRDAHIKDYITGQEIRATREEVEAVQVLARALVEDYGYGRGQIRTRPQWRVKVRPSDQRKSYPVDIAVFSSEEQTDQTLRIVAECKKKSRRDGLGQLKDYLRLSTAVAGVWFNGEERVFLAKRERKGRVEFDEIPNIPRNGERLEDIGKHRRRDLVAPHNLKVAFGVIRNHLAGNAVGVTLDGALAQQLINLIFCKIYDERFTAKNDILEFRAGVDETPREIAERIGALFDKVKGKYREVLDFDDRVALDDRSIAYVVGELQNFCLAEAQRDVIADAFEMFISGALKGGQGQFFTPRNVVRLMVELVDPAPDGLLIDPACGSGGFLVESLKRIWERVDQQASRLGWSEKTANEEKAAAAVKCVHGLEKDSFLNKVAKAYMAIIGDGKGGIFCEDALEDPKNWAAAARQRVGLGRFDFVLTNPPFGKSIKITGEEKLAQYELSRAWRPENPENPGSPLVPGETRREEVRPEVLFVERCMQLLRDGGVMGIILPETFFHAGSGAHVLAFLERHNIKWLIDLPHNTFRPHNNAKCVAVILQKNAPQDREIGMAVAEEMGHDHQGRILHRWDHRRQKIDRGKIWDDIQVILKEVRDGGRKRHVFRTKSEAPRGNRVYVPRYYWRTREREVESVARERGLVLRPMSELLDGGIVRAFDGDGSPRADYKGRGDIPYVRVKDIVNWEIYKNPTATVPEWVYRKMTERKPEENFLRERDILYVRRGSYRIGSVAMASPHDLRVLLTRELLVLRVEREENDHGLNPHYLLYLLSHRLVKMQEFNRVLIETTLPNIADRWRDLRLPFFADRAEAAAVSKRVREAIASKWAAVDRIERLRREHGELTT